MKRESRRAFLIRTVTEQKEWIVTCGGDLSGYIAHYGDPNLDNCYGSGGTNIYKADTDALKHWEEKLAASRPSKHEKHFESYRDGTQEKW